MASQNRVSTPSHEWISLRLILQTVGIYALLVAVAIRLAHSPLFWPRLLLIPIWFAIGVWLDRMYTVAHEGVHRKLFPDQRFLNDAISTLLLIPISAPFSLFRRIHFFHHSANRRDPATAALDTFVLSRRPTGIGRLYYRAAWIFCVFLGGFFVHTLISFVLFLVVPTRLSQRISPVFRGFGWADRLRAWGELAAALAVHLFLFRWLGMSDFVVGFVLPLIPFAWVFSLLLYIYHYRVSFGSDVRHNVRSLPQQRVFSWLLLNFNQHATHHHDPSLPWYQLTRQPHELPEPLAGNNDVSSLWQAIAQLRRGPVLFVRDAGELKRVDS